MTILRRHLAAVALFPVGLLGITFGLALLICVVESPDTIGLLLAIVPAAAVVALAAGFGLVFCRRGPARARAEWSVLAPVLAAASVLTLYGYNIVGNFVRGPRDVFTSPGTPEGLVVSVALLIGVSWACAAAASWWMGRPAGGRAAAPWWHDLAAVALLTAFAACQRSASTQVADALGWGAGPNLETSFEGAHLRSAAHSAFALAGIVVPCLLAALLLWRRGDALSRWRGLAVMGAWVTLYHWLSHFYRLTPRLAYDHWGQAALFGVIAGIAAVLYSEAVVARLWRRAEAVPDGR